jgi:hypothetical protein
MDTRKFKNGAEVTRLDGEVGEVVGYADFTDREPHYMIRRKTPDGMLDEWWAEGSIADPTVHAA